MTKQELIKHIESELSKNGFESAHFEAQQLAAQCRNLEHAEELLKRRLRHEPLQYILGEWEFYGITLKVGDGVLIPRQDTETVAETAINLLSDTQNPTVFDLCAGSGCLGLAIEKHAGAKVNFFEKSEKALRFLEENLKLTNSCGQIFKTDVLMPPPEEFYGVADMIFSNPPYIRSCVMPTLEKEVRLEPQMALDGGEDGLMFYRTIAKLWKPALKKGGYLVFEIGFDQQAQVEHILKSEGFEDIKAIRDLCGNFRVIIGKF